MCRINQSRSALPEDIHHRQLMRMSMRSCMQEQIPGERDETMRMDIIERINSVVAKGLCGYTDLRVEPYGSFVSGLCTPGGDLDIAIEGGSPGGW